MLIKIIIAINVKKNIDGSQIKIIIGKTKKIYINGTFLENLKFEIFKKIINVINKNISFLAKTSSSDNGYNRNAGENIAIIVKMFFGRSFMYE